MKVLLVLNKELPRAAKENKIQQQIAKTDKEIDDLVYKLYRITEKEWTIIEEKNEENRIKT